jgi:protein TonB
MVGPMTENVRFKQGYAGFVLFSFLIAVAIHLAFFSLSPPFHIKPFTLVEKELIQVVSIDWAEPDRPPAAPPGPPVQIVPAGEGEEGVDGVDVPQNAFGELQAFPPPISSEMERPEPVFVFDRPPVLLRAVNPVYPELSRQAGLEGQVLLRALIGEDGAVLEVAVIRSNVTPAMEKAAIAAARQFAFLPARQGTVPVRAQVAVPITFKLH